MFKKQIIVDANTKILRLGGNPPKAVKILLALQVIVFLLFLFADAPKALVDNLALSAQGSLQEFKFWQFISAIFIHLGMRSFVLDLLALWLFGSALERWWGAKRFTVFFLTTSIISLIVGAIIGLSQPLVLTGGSQGAATGMLLAITFIFPEHLAFIYKLTPFKSSHLSILAGLTILVGSLISGLYLDLSIQLSGIVVALFFIGPKRFMGQMKKKGEQKKLKVIKGGKSEEKWLN